MVVCSTCGLPSELCVCEEIARETQKLRIYTVKRKFGKLMTIIEGFNEKDVDLKNLSKKLKSYCACGGTAKEGKIELQGDQRETAGKALQKLGFSEDMIDII
ncbi:MAG: stress response translation initiation inhibitor YciH [Candidatus Hydrothermarchaeota archaeon]